MDFDPQPLIAYIPMDRRQALARARVLPDRTYGAALFADISGFTPLTEALTTELGHRRGAEELTRQLNAVYSALAERVHQYGGSIISFSGDAITCWFDKDDGIRATGCALAIQHVMRAFAEVRTPGGQTAALAIKVALTTGDVRRFVVGDPAIQTIDVLAGATLADMATAEKHAYKGEIVIGPEGMRQLGNKVNVTSWREDEHGARFAVIDSLRVPVTLAAPWPAQPPDALAAVQIRPWLLPPVYERLRRGQDQFLAELRPAVTLFLRFTGLDYDGDDAAGDKLDAYMRWVQNVLAQYEGYLLQITVGDKGSYLYAAYGAPITHGDDALRATAAAMELRSPPAAFDFITSTQIGISQGRMRTGAYGGEVRRTYGVLGDAVNISARLMSAAQPGQVLVSQGVSTQIARHYHCRSLGAIPLKGRKDPLAVCEVIASRQPSAQRPSSLYSQPLVGRDADLEQLQQWAALALQQQGQVMHLEGAAGMGKSHLAAEFSERAIQAGFHLVVGTCQSTMQGAPYFLWQQVFRTFFELGDSLPASATDRATLLQQQVARIEQRLGALNPDWLLRLPLLGDLLGLTIPDNSVTASFDPRLRQEALFTLAVDILQHWAQTQPLLLLLEDVHWMDEASQGLTVALSRALQHSSMVILLVQRPPLVHDRTLLPDLQSLAYHHRLDLTELSAAGVEALVSNHLGGRATPLTLALIETQAQGNPFFVEELVNTLREAGHLYWNEEDDSWRLSDGIFRALMQANALIKKNGEWVLSPQISLSVADLGIPDSIHGIVLSRMDRLDEGEKLTLKVASVIGRTFGLLLLTHAHPAHPTLYLLQEQIDQMEGRDFLRLEIPEPQLTYIFKHNTTQEVSYETLLFAQRRELHRVVASWYEQTYRDDKQGSDSALAPYYALLAYHWRQAEEPEKERLYARLAGEQAAARFANEEAATYFSRALALTSKNDYRARFRLVLAREAVYDLTGQRDDQAQDLIQLQALAETLGDDQIHAQVSLRFAGYYEATSDFGSARMVAQQAVQWAEQAADPQRKVEGLIVWGMALWRRGELEQARQHLQRALALSQENQNEAGEAMSLHHLGTVNYITGDFDGARTCLEQALDIRRQLEDLIGEAASLNNLASIYFTGGNYAESMKYHKQVLDIYQAIGNRSNEAIALSNLASSHHALGALDTARAYFQESLSLCQTMVNRQGETLAAFNLGLVLYDLGEYASAQMYSQMAMAIDRDIGDKVGEGYSLTGYALALEGQQAWEAAAAAYQEAYELRQKLGQDAHAIDDLAGTARVRLARGDTAGAQTAVDQIMAWIAEHGLHGIEYPLRVYLTCIEVLAAGGDRVAARQIWEQAQQLITTQAERISDPETRAAFLQQVPLHRQIYALSETLNLS